MSKNNYYALVAGLKEYTLESEKRGFSLKDILSEIEEEVSPADFRSVSLLYNFFDCENIIAFRSGSSTYNSLGLLQKDKIEDEIKEPVLLPEALWRTIRAFDNPEGEEAEDVDTTRPFDTALFTAYYNMLAVSESSFLRKWGLFDRIIRNVQAGTIARRKGAALADVMTGDDELFVTMSSSSAQDFSIRSEYSFVDELIQILSEERNLLEKERRLDSIRLKEIDEMVEYDYFNMNYVLAYLCKLNIISRWMKLDPQTGREMLDEMLQGFDAKEKISKI